MPETKNSMSGSHDQQEIPRTVSNLGSVEEEKGQSTQDQIESHETESREAAPAESGLESSSRTEEDRNSSQSASTRANMPASSNTSEYASSIRAGSVSTASTRPLLEKERRSSISRAMDKMKSKLAGSERLPSDAAEFERAKEKEIEKQKRKEEYERLGLGDRTKFGTPGAGGWNA